MATQYTSKLKIPYCQDGDKAWNAVYSSAFATIDACAALGPLAVVMTEIPSSTLNVAVRAGSFRSSNGPAVSYGGSSSVAMTASATTYLWLDDSGSLHTGTSLPTSSWYVPLASVVAGASTITSITDLRPVFASVGGAYTSSFLTLAGGALSGPLVGQSYACTARTITATGSMAASDGAIFCNATSGAITFTLLDPTTVPGRLVEVYKTDSSSNAVTIATPAGSILGSGGTSISSQYGAVTLRSDGANWYVRGIH